MGRAMCMFFVLVTVSGCLLDTFHKDDAMKNTGLPKLPPVAVSADQVHTKNAHEQATALFDEIEFDESQARSASH